MNGLLALDPQQRTSAKDAMEHCWFTTEKPAPTSLGEMPQVGTEQGQGGAGRGRKAVGSISAVGEGSEEPLAFCGISADDAALEDDVAFF